MANIIQRMFSRNEDTGMTPMVVSAGSTGQRIHLQETALETVVTYITDRASLVLLKTNEQKLHHRWNVRPNPYQNAQEFKRELLRKMLIDGECMVVQETSNNHYLHIASSYSEEREGMGEVFYNDVTVEGENLGTKPASEVYLFRYKNERVVKWIQQLDRDYVDLFNRIVEIQKLQSQLRIYPKFRTVGAKNRESQEKFMKFLEKFQEAVNTQQVVITPTQDDYDISENKSAFKGFNVDEVSKVERIYLSNVCRLYGISPSLFSVELADITEHRDDFVRFVHSIMQILATEINSKYFQDNEAELKENQVRVVTFYLEYNSTFKAANAIEKLLGAGHTIDQIREMQGLDPIGDEHTTRRYLTRNIGGIEQADLKGGAVVNDERTSND